ncbi:MAG: heterodisulfide reductase-related iron-sulfur binding cluster [Verrucomicrobiia bacterium]
MRVALFIPCFIDQLLPNVGAAMAAVLRRLQVDVYNPPQQTCTWPTASQSGLLR